MHTPGFGRFKFHLDELTVLPPKGLPKAAVITQERLWAATFIQSLAGVTSKDIFYINLPLYHSAGFSIGFAGAIERGELFLNVNILSTPHRRSHHHNITTSCYVKYIYSGQ